MKTAALIYLAASCGAVLGFVIGAIFSVGGRNDVDH